MKPHECEFEEKETYQTCYDCKGDAVVWQADVTRPPDKYGNDYGSTVACPTCNGRGRIKIIILVCRICGKVG